MVRIRKDLIPGMEFKDDQQSTRNEYVQYRSARDSGMDIDYSGDHLMRSWCNHDKEHPVTCPVNYRFQEALYYRTYLLADL